MENGECHLLTSSKRFCSARIDDFVGGACCCCCWGVPVSFCSSNITCLKQSTGGTYTRINETKSKKRKNMFIFNFNYITLCTMIPNSGYYSIMIKCTCALQQLLQAALDCTCNVMGNEADEYDGCVLHFIKKIKSDYKCKWQIYI